MIDIANLLYNETISLVLIKQDPGLEQLCAANQINSTWMNPISPIIPTD